VARHPVVPAQPPACQMARAVPGQNVRALAPLLQVATGPDGNGGEARIIRPNVPSLAR